MVREFKKVNESFNSFKPFLSKVLTKARENSATKTYSSHFVKYKIWETQFPEGQRFTSWRVSHSILRDALTSNRKNILSY